MQWPKNWTEMPKDTSVSLFGLLPASQEYQQVHKLFTRTSTKKVVQIMRIQNPALYLRYKAFKQMLDFDPNCKNKSNEMLLWHGFDADCIRQIYTNGFNGGFAGKKGEVYNNMMVVQPMSVYRHA